jgi:hypothetical protein
MSEHIPYPTEVVVTAQQYDKHIQKNYPLQLAATILTAAIALTGIGVTGCERKDSEPSQTAATDMDKKIQEYIDGTSPSEKYELPLNKPTDIGVIDTRTMPEVLPPAVRSLLPRVVKIRAGKAPSPEGFARGETGSGFRLDQNTVLTAQHVIADRSGKKASVDCKAAYVEAMTTYHEGQSFNGSVKRDDFTGEKKPIEAMHAFSDYEGDVALLDVAGLNAQTIKDKPAVVIRDLAAQPVTPGERLYTLSFGANIDGPEREPKQDKFMIVQGPNKIQGDMLPGQSEPKVIGGIAIGGKTPKDGIGMMPVRDYSAMPEPQQRNKPGDSGGALVDEQGRLIGVISRLDIPAYTTPSTLLEAYTPNDRQAPNIDYIETEKQYYAQRYAPISPEVITKLSARTPVSCS